MGYVISFMPAENGIIVSIEDEGGVYYNMVYKSDNNELITDIKDFMGIIDFSVDKNIKIKKFKKYDIIKVMKVDNGYIIEVIVGENVYKYIYLNKEHNIFLNHIFLLLGLI